MRSEHPPEPELETQDGRQHNGTAELVGNHFLLGNSFIWKEKDAILNSFTFSH